MIASVSWLAATTGAAGAPPSLLVWIIGAGVLCITAAFAYLGRLALRETNNDQRRLVQRSFMSEIELKPVKLDRDAARDLRAFVAIARKLKLSRSDRQFVRRIAQATDTPAPAILLSEHAYDTAVGALEESSRVEPSSPEHREIARIRARLFSSA